MFPRHTNRIFSIASLQAISLLDELHYRKYMWVLVHVLLYKEFYLL
jgi:hypothetical protein